MNGEVSSDDVGLGSASLAHVRESEQRVGVRVSGGVGMRVSEGVGVGVGMRGGMGVRVRVRVWGS